VFSCIELPGLDGYEVAKEIRKSLPNKPLLVAHTSYGKWQIGERAKEAGFDVLLTKPASIADLWRVLSFIEGTTDCEDLRL
jgi:CheY-like chemotaxis protein